MQQQGAINPLAIGQHKSTFMLMRVCVCVADARGGAREDCGIYCYEAAGFAG
jgi:hypothetical protein